jgi:hypothetical protein
MAVIPQISTPIGNKGFSQNTLAGKQAGLGGGQFDVIQLMNPLESASVADREAGRQSALLEQKDFLPMMVKLTKDPTMAVESLKQILNYDLLAIAKANGYTELAGELETLMKSMFLKPDGLVAEIMAQEKSTTMFSGDKFFDLLRQIASGADGKPNAEELKAALGNMLKAVNFTKNQQEILGALSANMKFLSHYFSPNKALSADLATLAERWAAADAAENFNNLKNDTLFLTKNVTESLLNNERIQVLVPLIVHNLSRYNTNIAVMNEYFAGLLTQVSGHSLRQELSDAFGKLAESLFGSAGAREAEQAYQSLKEAEANPLQAREQAEQSAGQAPVITLPEAQGQNAVARYLGELMANGDGGLIYDEEKLNAAVRSFLLGKESGMETIKLMLDSLLGNPDMRAALEADMARITDIGKLVEYLNIILQNMPDVPERQGFFEFLNDVISTMAERGELPATDEKQSAPDKAPLPGQHEAGAKEPFENRESTLKQLIEFIEKNIDHAAIKTINNYNASNLLQSLINAPGVFTPLAHYILPLDVDGIRSFGELWVDADDGNAAAKASGGKAKYHLFLSFEVEAAGRFEVDLYADGRDVNLSFFYPESFSEKAAPLLGKVNRIIAGTGYTTREIRTGPLIKPHDLTQIFPDILEKRTGFNIMA